MIGCHLILYVMHLALRDRRKSYATQSYMIIYHLILDVMHLAPPVTGGDMRAGQAGLGMIEDAIREHPCGVPLRLPG